MLMIKELRMEIKELTQTEQEALLYIIRGMKIRNAMNEKYSKKPHSTVIKQSNEADDWEQKLPDVSHIPTYAEWEQSKKPAPFMVNGKPFSLI